MDMTFRDFWEWRVARSAASPFIHHAGETHTYADFDRSINRLANGMAAAGIEQGHKVALFLDNSFELLRIQWALQKLGAIWTPIIPSSTAAEAAHVLDHSQAEVLIAGPDQRERIDDRGRLVLIDVSEGDSDAPPPALTIDPMAPMALMYTSGSTGKPKGVLQPNAGYRTISHAFAGRLELTEDDVWICTLPLFHSAATHLLLGPTIAAGASLLLVPKFSRTTFWADARHHRATVTLLFPAQMSMLMTNPVRDDDRDNDIRVAMSHVTSAAFTERFGVEILTAFSSTESLGLGVMTPPRSGRDAPGLVGPALPEDLEIKVVGSGGAPVPTGESGEICFKHPHLMLGYYRDEENTAQALRDGWLHTGDIGSLDEQGWITFHGRLKNMIKRQGENIAGEEVEFALMRHPDVEEAVVCGVPDPMRTEEVYAIVHPREGHMLNLDELIATAEKELSAWKLPRFVRIEPAPFPRLANGKLDRVSLTANVSTARAWDRDAQRTPA